ncbi:unnamed protein product [Gadus morhua 'NCC']
MFFSLRRDPPLIPEREARAYHELSQGRADNKPSAFVRLAVRRADVCEESKPDLLQPFISRTACYPRPESRLGTVFS